MRKEARKHNEKLEEQLAVIETLIEENKRLNDEKTKENLEWRREVKKQQAKVDNLEGTNRKLQDEKLQIA